MSPSKKLCRFGAALGASLALAGAAAAANPVRGNLMPASFFEGVFYFNVAMGGGTHLDDSLRASGDLQRVRFVPEDRFLVVELAEDQYTNPNDPTLRSVLARFPMERRDDKLAVFWGDDPTPFVATLGYRTRRGTKHAVFEGGGKFDVHDFEYDSKAGVLTFVKEMPLVERSAGITKHVRVRYNFMKARDTGYKPARAGDHWDKFGYFLSFPELLVDGETGHLAKRAFRMRIDHTKPFVYEIHPTVPEVCHQPIKDAIESWNDVFEERTGHRPLGVKMGQKDHLPGDLRYHVIYFRSRGRTEGGHSAYGPPVAIAHTGQIVDADVIVDGTMLMGHYQETREAEAELAKAAAEEDKKGVLESFQFAFGKVPLGVSRAVPEHGGLYSGMLEDLLNEADPQRAGKEGDAARRFYYKVRGLMTHEIGHNLGLRHNFGASTDHRNIPENGISTSVMDYTHRNHHHHGPKAYDRAAIAYGYGGQVTQAEIEGLRYLTDHDADTHPQANRHDHGDPFEYYKKVIALAVGDALRNAAKPRHDLDKAKGLLDRSLSRLIKYVNSGDPKEGEVFQYFTDLLSYRFQGDAHYTAIEYLSATKFYVAWFLMNTEDLVERDLTRNQRRAVAKILGEAMADNKNVLEADRLRFARMLGKQGNITARNALKAAKQAIESRLETDDSLRDKDAEIEENVLLHIEKALNALMGA